MNTDQVLVSQVETQPTGRRSWSEVCSCRPPGARSYDSNISILNVLLINNQHDMCRELDLFVNRLPVLLSIFPVETETCAFGNFSPVLLSSKASSLHHLTIIWSKSTWSSQPLSYHLNKQVLIIFKTYHSTFGVVVVNQSFGDMNSSNLRLKVVKGARVSTIWLWQGFS